MIARFVLIIPDENAAVDFADCPEDLNFDAAYDFSRWEVQVRYGNTFTCLARVNLEGSTDYDNDFERAANEVCTELKLRNGYGEFDDLTSLPDDPVVDIGHECPSCAPRGCRNCDRGHPNA